LRDWDKVLADTEAALRINPKLPFAHYLRGRALTARAEFDDAIAEFDRTLRLEPGAIWAIVFRADNYGYRREYSRALQDLKRAVERFPKAEASHLGLAWFLATCPHDAYRNGEEAVTEAMRGCEISHWANWYAADALGAAYAEQGDFDQAIKFAKFALTLPGTSPKDRDLIEQRLSRYQYRIAIRDIGGAEISRTLFEEAASAYSQQDYDRALLCLNTVLPPNPGASASAAVFNFFDGTHDKRTRPPWAPKESTTMTNGFYYRGLSYEKKREWDKAIADFTTVIWREPQSSLALAERGVSYNHKQRTEPALRDFAEMLRLNPNDAMAYALRADTLQMTGQWDAALEVAATAIRLDPKLSLAYEVCGRAYTRKKDYKNADSEFHEAERLDRDHVKNILFSAYTFERRHDYKIAEAEFRETAERFPRSAHAHNALAWLLATCPEAAIRNGAEAVTHATTACELTQWNDAGFLDTLAAAYAETGDFAQAIKYVEEAILKMRARASYQKEVEEHLVRFQRKEPWRAKR
jgi:tetratricopeptide (TPR) repeat protein